jgi:hypothetical protein
MTIILTCIFFSSSAFSLSRSDDAPVVGGVGDVAAGAARHQDLDARLAVLLQQQHAPATLRGPARREQAGGAGPDHDHVPDFRHASPLHPRALFRRTERR